MALGVVLGFRLGLFAFVQKLEELLLEKAPMGEASLQVDRAENSWAPCNGLL